jgi:hypothetical protein
MPLNPGPLRSMVDGWLNDECVIHSPSAPVFDLGVGIDTVGEGAQVYAGKCRLRPTGGARVVIAGDAPMTLRLFDLTLPWDTEGVLVDQLVTLTASNDPYVMDRVYRVVDVQGGSDSVYRRLVVEDTLTIDDGVAEEVGS